MPRKQEPQKQGVGYVNACMHRTSLNLDRYAPMLDRMEHSQRAAALNAWYMAVAYGESTEAPRAAVQFLMAIQSDVARARSNAAAKADPTRPDTRPLARGNE